uniref:Uncharacterized protein n=1 Tax=Ralstonia solanacearum TaxID=305 RepID=A0A0S4UY35_RALSL|nr:protein of unknown function [Ralstonia solanacearum]
MPKICFFSMGRFVQVDGCFASEG